MKFFAGIALLTLLILLIFLIKRVCLRLSAGGKHLPPRRDGGV